MIRLSIKIIVLSSTLLSTVVIAQDAADRRGFAINGGIGASVIRDEDGTETFRGNAFGFNLGFEYRFTQNFALGLGTFNLGEASDTIDSIDTNIDVRGIDILARFYIPMSEKVELFALVGGANYYVDLEPGGTNGLFGDDAWELGGGVDFITDEDFSIRFEGRFFNGTRDESAGLVTVGFSYRF